MKPEAQSFYDRPAWKSLRYCVLKKLGARCLLCGRGRESGITIHVDHIRPVSIYPELALTEDNLQVLCSECNQGKSNRDMQDFRPKLKIIPHAPTRAEPDLIETIAVRLKQEAIRLSDTQDDSKAAAALRKLLEFRRALSVRDLSGAERVAIARTFEQGLNSVVRETHMEAVT